MELFDALEQKIVDLLREVAALRARNQDLETQLSFAKEAGEGETAVQVAELSRALEREKKLRGDVLRRIDVLVRYLEEHSGAG
jgi:cell division septum initiation protein DivIVA